GPTCRNPVQPVHPREPVGLASVLSANSCIWRVALSRGAPREARLDDAADRVGVVPGAPGGPLGSPAAPAEKAVCTSARAGHYSGRDALAGIEPGWPTCC